jgi:hypothetical protein
MKPLITAADLERVPQDGELAITEDTLITPLAREEAERRRITFRIASSREHDPSESWRLARITAASNSRKN